MPGNVDRRVRKSRAAIFKAFEDLLAEKSYASITVSDVIERADVGRTTFYDHFSTKDAMLDELCRDLFSHVASPEDEASHSFHREDGMKDKLSHILLHLKEDAKRLRPLLTGPASDLFWNSFSAELEGFFFSEQGRTIHCGRSVEDALYARFLASSLMDIIRWELKHGSIDPDRASAAFFELTGVREKREDCAAAATKAQRLGCGSDVEEALRRSLLYLLEDRKLSALTVTEVARRANVGRSTFYAHYSSLEDVYADLVWEAMVDVQSVGEHFRSDDCKSCAGADRKVPFCFRLRNQGKYAPVIEDPAFARTWIAVSSKDGEHMRTLKRLVDAGLTPDQAHAVIFFQACGCLMVARTVPRGDACWERIQAVLDDFIRAGYKAVSKDSLFSC